MLLGMLAEDGAAAKAALAAGADIAILRTSAGAAAAEVKSAGQPANDASLGAWLDRLDGAAGDALAGAGCDFIVGTLEGTVATAVDTEKTGLVLVVDPSIEDNILRALGPLGLDALLVEHGFGEMSLADQLKLVRLASFASTPLIVTTRPEAPAAELRVLRDSGTVCVLVPSGTPESKLRELSDRLRELPPRKARREGGDIAIVPAVAAMRHEEEVHEPDEEDE
jgi:hypothetical protein